MAYNAYLLKSVGIREVTSCTSLLFAIPKFREIQPGIPGVGCLIDIVGFNWNISMIAVSGVVLLILYVHDMEKRVKMMEVVVGGGGGGDDHMKPDVVPVRPAGRDPIKDKHANEDYFCHNIC